MADEKKYFDVSPPPLKPKNHNFLKKDENTKNIDKQEEKETADANPDLEQPEVDKSKTPQEETVVNQQAPEVKPLAEAVSKEVKDKPQDEKPGLPEVKTGLIKEDAKDKREDMPLEAKQPEIENEEPQNKIEAKDAKEPENSKTIEGKPEQGDPKKSEGANISTSPASSGVIDALPDPGEKAAIEAQDNMQEPKIYDTKEYYVPIGKAHHKHGNTKMAFFFGVLLAILVIAAAVYIMFLMGD